MANEVRRLAMRRAHARRAWFCTCGRTIHGNGGSTSHAAKHKREGDGHHYVTASEHGKQKLECSHAD